jgi:lysophospholipase L1-like esterase
MFSFETLRVSLTWPRAVVVGVLLFAGADMAQRKLLPPREARFHLKVPNSRSVYETDLKMLPGVSGDSHVSINSLGIRGPEMPSGTNACKILCLGDSVTECIRLDDTETWPAVLMRRLNSGPDMPRVWVGNAGQSALASVHHLEFLKQTELLRAVHCVVLMAGTADLTYALGDVADEDPRTTPVTKKRRSWLDPFLKQMQRKFRKPRKPDLATEDSKGAVYAARRKARQEAEKTDTLPDLAPALRRYQDNLRAIATVCRDNGVRPVFVSTASVCSTNLPPQNEDIIWGGKLADGRYLSEAGFCKGFEMFNQAMADVARELAVEFVDTSSLSGRRPFFYDASHFNEEGARAVAALVADHLLACRGARRWQPDGPAPAAAPK